MRRVLPNLLLMAGVIGLDQLTKALVARSLECTSTCRWWTAC